MALQGKLEADFSQFVDEGKKVEASLGRMEGGAARVGTQLDHATTPASNFGKQLREVDNVMDQVGINLTSVSRGITDFENALAKGINNLSLLEKGVLTTSAAMAGWEIGRKAAEFFELDTKIGDATAKLLGWGDVAGEKAAAAANTLAKASKAVGFEIHDLNTALIINKAGAEDAILANRNLAAQFAAEAKAAKDAAAEIDRVHQGNADKFFKLTQDWIAAMHAREAAGIEAAEKAKQSMFDEIDAATKAAEAHQKLGIAAMEAEDLAKQKIDETTAALKAQKDAADAAARAMGNEITYDLSTPEGFAKFQKLNPSASISVGSDYFKTHTLQDAIEAGLIDLYAGFRSGLPSSRVPPTVSTAPGSGAAPVTVHVSGVLDPRTVDELGKAVGKAFVTGRKVAA